METKKVKRLRYRHSRGETIIVFDKFDAQPFSRLMPGVRSRRAVLVTDEIVDRLWGDAVRTWLGDREILTVTVPPRETAKDLEHASLIFEKLYEWQIDRGVPLIALGGGFLTDIAGFSAGTYLRGLPYLSIPTTLLGQVDASIGGKCGLNFGGGKNILGCFYHPSRILIDSHLLNSLPRRELNSGLAEVIKCVALNGREALSAFDNHLPKFQEKGISALLKPIVAAVHTKIRLVRADEFDLLDKRALLNYGHTVGHAIESSEQMQLTHGECVGLGMLAAAHLAQRLTNSPEQYFTRLKHILGTVGLPVSFSNIDVDKTVEFLLKDKKVRNGKIQMLLPDSKGVVKTYNDITSEQIGITLRELKTL